MYDFFITLLGLTGALIYIFWPALVVVLVLLWLGWVMKGGTPVRRLSREVCAQAAPYTARYKRLPGRFIRPRN